MKKLLILSLVLVGTNAYAMSTESAEKESLLNQRIITGFFEKKQREITEDQKNIAESNNSMLKVIKILKEWPIACQSILPSLKEKQPQEILIFKELKSELKEIKSKLTAFEQFQQQLDEKNTANNEKQLFLNTFRFHSAFDPKKTVSEIKRVAKNKLLHHHYDGYSEEAIADIKTLFQSEPVK